MQNKTERRRMTIKYEGKFFIIGVLLGCFSGILWQDFIYHYHFFKSPFSCVDVKEVKKETNYMLISYIDGTWSSSIGDLIVRIKYRDNRSFLVLETLNKTTERKYNIIEITDVNGILGTVKINICEEKYDCNAESDKKIPIQINKVFGKDKTITISYDSRLTYCIDSEDQCTRAFKRLEY